MTDKQKRVILIGAGVLIILLCSVAFFASVFFARYLIIPNLDDNTSVSTVFNETESQSLNEQGLLVIGLVPEGPADRAGLRRGNIILRANGIQVDRPQQLQRVLRSVGPGGTVNLEVLEGEVTRELSVTLGEDASLAIRVVGWEEPASRPQPITPPPETDVPSTPIAPGPPSIDQLPRQPLPFPMRAVVTGVVEDSPAAEAGLQVGDVITNIDDRAVLSSQELIDAIASYAPGDRVTVTVRRGNETLSFRITLAARPEDPAHGFLGVDLNTGFSGFPNLPGMPSD